MIEGEAIQYRSARSSLGRRWDSGSEGGEELFPVSPTAPSADFSASFFLDDEDDSELLNISRNFDFLAGAFARGGGSRSACCLLSESENSGAAGGVTTKSGAAILLWLSNGLSCPWSFVWKGDPAEAEVADCGISTERGSS